MFYGHIGAGLAVKSVTPGISLGWTLVAVSALDILAGAFTMAGLEGVLPDGSVSMPWSHGLLMSGVWSLGVLGIMFLISRDFRAALIFGGLVFSHWILDFISHPMGMGETLPPDLPLAFDPSRKVGLGLYNSVPGALITELGMLALGSFLYLRNTRPDDRQGKWAFALFLLFLAVVPATMGLPEELQYLVTFALLVLFPLGIWMDRHRSHKRRFPAKALHS